MFGTQVATTKHAVNRLINGGFYRVLLPIDETLVETINSADQPYSAVENRENQATSPSYRIPTDRPKETAIANWYIYGASGSVDIRPKDPDRGNTPVRGLHGPTPARVTFFEDGEIVIEQDIDEFWGLLDRDLTLSYFMAQGNGTIDVTVEAVYGSESSDVETLDANTSKTFPTGGLRKAQFTPPYDADQMTIRIRLGGNPDDSVYLGEFMLQLGKVAKPRFTDDIAADERPRSSIVFFVGDEVPPGYVLVCESEDRFYYPTAGDARVNGIDRTAEGGSETHNHGGKTGGRTRSTTLKHTGSSQVDHHHKHIITEAEIDPPWVKILAVKKV